MTRFTVVHLKEDRFDEALPLVRMAAPLTTPQSWREFVRTLYAGMGGILATFAGDERPHGIAAYCPDQSLLQGRVLRVEPLVTFEVNRAAPVRAALCQALERLAREKGCEAVVIAACSRGYADGPGPKASAWKSLGFEMTSVDLVKRLERPRLPAPGAARLLEPCGGGR